MQVVTDDDCSKGLAEHLEGGKWNLNRILTDDLKKIPQYSCHKISKRDQSYILYQVVNMFVFCCKMRLSSTRICGTSFQSQSQKGRLCLFLFVVGTSLFSALETICCLQVVWFIQTVAKFRIYDISEKFEAKVLLLWCWLILCVCSPVIGFLHSCSAAPIDGKMGRVNFTNTYWPACSF